MFSLSLRGIYPATPVSSHHLKTCKKGVKFIGYSKLLEGQLWWFFVSTCRPLETCPGPGVPGLLPLSWDRLQPPRTG